MDRDPGQKSGFLITGQDAEKVSANRIRVALELLGMQNFDITIVPISEEAESQHKSPATEHMTVEPVRAEVPEYVPQPRGELYKRLVGLERVPQLARAGGTTVRLSIDTDRSISVNDRGMLFLSPHELFTVNALLINRDHPVTLDDLMEMGYFPDSANPISRRGSFSAIKNGLRSRLRLPETGRSLIVEDTVRGSMSKTYQLDPEVDLQLRDLRRRGA